MGIRIGDEGRALTPMCPSGAIEINGERLDARSEGQFIEVGGRVVVLRGDPTGFVVRKLALGQPLPELPGRGQPIRKAEFQRNSAEVAEADRQERTEARRRLLQGLRHGAIAAMSLGAFIGLASGGAAWYFDWIDIAPIGPPLLLGGSLVAGALAGGVLFFVTGLVGSFLGLVSDAEPEFAPNFFATFAALIGAAIGFWVQFAAGDAGKIALWSVGGAVVFAAVAYVVSWVAGKLLG